MSFGILDDAAYAMIERDFYKADLEERCGNKKFAQKLRDDIERLRKTDFLVRRKQAKDLGLI